MKRKNKCANYDALERRGVMMQPNHRSLSLLDQRCEALSAYWTKEVETFWKQLPTQERVKRLLVANPTLPEKANKGSVFEKIMPEIAISEFRKKATHLEDMVSLLLDPNVFAETCAFVQSKNLPRTKMADQIFIMTDQWRVVNNWEEIKKSELWNSGYIVNGDIASYGFQRLDALCITALTLVSDLRDELRLPIPGPLLYVCCVCQVEMPKKKTCSSCTVPLYCSVECQHAHWKEVRHQGNKSSLR